MLKEEKRSINQTNTNCDKHVSQRRNLPLGKPQASARECRQCVKGGLQLICPPHSQRWTVNEQRLFLFVLVALIPDSGSGWTSCENASDGMSNVVARYVDALSAPQISVGVGWSTAVTRGGRATPLLMTKADHMATSADQKVKVPLLTSN